MPFIAKCGKVGSMDANLISIKQAGIILGISRRRVAQMVDEGRLPAFRVSWQWVIDRNDVAEFAKTYKRNGRSKRNHKG